MLFGKKRDYELALLLDIGSTSVGAALAAFQKNKNPLIVYTVRQPIQLQKDLDFKRFYDAMLASLSETLLHVQKEGLTAAKKHSFSSKINLISTVFASPWYLSETKTIHVSKKEPFVVTKKMIDTLVLKAEEDFQNSRMAKYSEKTENDADIIELKTIQITLNGYTSINPYEKKTTVLDMSLFMSLVSKHVIKGVTHLIEKNFHSKKVQFNSLSLCAFTSLRDMYPETHDFLFIDIGGEVTDIGVVKSGILMKTVSFPFGRNYLTRIAADMFKVMPEEALSLLRLKLQERSSPALDLSFEAFFKDVNSKWKTSFEAVLDDLAFEFSSFNKVFLLADKDIGSYFLHTIQMSKNSLITPQATLFLEEKHLVKWCDFATADLAHPVTLLQSLFINKDLSSRL